MGIKIAYLAKVDLGKTTRLVVLFHNEEKDKFVPFAAASSDVGAQILYKLGFGILVEPEVISLEKFREDVKNNVMLGRINWNKMGVHE
jgi:hypothetical protein